MDLEKLKNFGYKVDNNYVFSENLSLETKIRIIIPYGFNNKDLLVFPYANIFLGILDNFFTFPCKIDYEMGPTYCILKFKVYDLYNVPIVLGTIFNFMETMDVNKITDNIFEDEKSLLEKFIDSNRAVYNEGKYEFLSYNGKSIPDLMYSEYQFLSTASIEDINKKLENTKEVFKEEKVMIFLQGMNVSKLECKSNVLKNNKIEKCSFNDNNKFSIIDNAKTITLYFEDTYEDKLNFVLNLFIIDFYAELFETHKIITNIKGALVFYFDTDINKYGRDILTRKWGNRIFREDDEELASLFADYKCKFLDKVISKYDNYENDIDSAIEVFTGNEIYYTRAEIIEIINQITIRDFHTFITQDLFFIIDIIENASKKEDDNNV